MTESESVRVRDNNLRLSATLSHQQNTSSVTDTFDVSYPVIPVYTFIVRLSYFSVLFITLFQARASGLWSAGPQLQ